MTALDPISAILAFSVAALLMTLTPGLDTALVLRTAAIEGGRRAMLAGTGIATGCLAWGLAAALGLGALLAISETAYLVLQIAGACYLLYLGFGMVRTALRRDRTALNAQNPTLPREISGAAWFLRGLLTNLLNPKVGVFYVSFLPQFVPQGVEVVSFSAMLATIHAAMGILWFLALTLATRPLANLLRKPVVTKAMDGITGLVLIGFGLRLLIDRR